MNIFSDRAGRVALVPDVGFPLTVALERWPGAQTMRAIITSAGIDENENVEFKSTLRNFMHVYSFGSRLGEIVIGGMAFATDCLFGVDSGLDALMDYYNTCKLSNLGGPVAVAIGARTSFQGFLVGLKINAADPQTGLSQFAFKLNTFTIDRPTGGRIGSPTTVSPATGTGGQTPTPGPFTGFSSLPQPTSNFGFGGAAGNGIGSLQNLPQPTSNFGFGGGPLASGPASSRTGLPPPPRP